MAALVMQNEADQRTDGARGQGGRVVLVAALLVVSGTFLSLLLERMDGMVLFPLETVRFDGDLRHVRERDLRAAVEPHLRGDLLTVDVVAARHAVEALPWVAAAAVRRVWPDAVRVTVREHEAVARWGDDGLLDDGGVVFRPERRPEQLPVLSGPAGSAREVLARFRDYRERLAGVGLTLTGLRMDERRSWIAELADRGVIRLGQDSIETRLERFVRAWPAAAAGRDTGFESVDLRYPNGFAVNWREDGDGSAGPSRKD